MGLKLYELNPGYYIARDWGGANINHTQPDWIIVRVAWNEDETRRVVENFDRCQGEFSDAKYYEFRSRVEMPTGDIES